MPSKSTELSHQNVLHLVLKSEHDRILVTPENEDRFCVKVNRLIEAFRIASQRDEFFSQFAILLQKLATWLSEQDGGIEDAFVTLRDGGLSFVVVRSCSKYDEEFDDALSELDLDIANDVDLDLISLNTIALPNVSRESLDSFLDREVSLKFTDAI